MARDNNFVVIERAKVLEQGPEDMKKEDTAIMIYNVALWPGKATKKPVVPGERVRIKMGKASKNSKKGMHAHVLLAEELRDVCVGLSTLQDAEGKYRTAGLPCHIKVHQRPRPETPADRDNRERALLEPLQKLRHFQAVSIEGTLPAINYQITQQLTHQTLDRNLVVTTIDELIADGDRSSSNGDYDIATAYYQRTHEYFHHSTTHARHVFTDPADVLAFEFRTTQHRSLNWILAGNFSDALEVADIAIDVATQLFRLGSPMTNPPWAGPDGHVGAAALRKWTCDYVKAGAASCGQKIKAEDVGRCYYYKSIAEHIVYGDDATDQADDDKFTGIGCCVVSETMKDNVPGELLQLDIQTMEGLSKSCGEHAEDDGDEEGWVDEEWEDDEREDE